MDTVGSTDYNSDTFQAVHWAVSFNVEMYGSSLLKIGKQVKQCFFFLFSPVQANFFYSPITALNIT